jgi:FkbM family methyltransferase
VLRKALARARALTVDLPTTMRDRRDERHIELLLAFTLAEDSNCIDVGAFTGTVLRRMVSLAPRGRHIAYEPIPRLHSRLVEEFPRVDVRRAALSDHRGEKTFLDVSDAPAFSGFRERADSRNVMAEQISVPVEDLDSSLPSDYVPALIKIDVEGAELEVLRGAIQTISRHKPVVVFEHGKGAAPAYGTRPADVHELLCGEAGLRLFAIDGNGPLGVDAFIETVERGRVWNFVAHAGR